MRNRFLRVTGSAGLSPAVAGLIAASFTTAFGTGLIIALIPLLLLHLAGDGAALYFGISGVLAVGAAPVVGRFADGSRRPFELTAAYCTAQALGLIALLVPAPGLLVVCVSAVLMGTANSALGALQFTLLSLIVEPDEIGRVQSIRYWAVNAATGLGLLTCGAAQYLWNGTASRQLVAVDACTSIFAAAVMLRLRRVRLGHSKHLSRGRASPWSFLKNRNVRILVVAEFLTAAGGFAYLETAAPLAFGNRFGDDSALPSVTLATALVTLLAVQPMLFSSQSVTTARRHLLLSSVIWFGAGVAGLSSALTDSHTAALIAALVFALLFGVGEAFLGSTVNSLVAVLEPNAVGFLNGVLGSAFSVGLSVGSAASVFLVAGGATPILWALMMLFACLAAGSWMSLDSQGGRQVAGDPA